MSSNTSIKYVKNEAGHFQCPHCEKTCEKQNTMYYHIKKNHTNDYKFVCNHCEGDARNFIQKSAYLQHMAIAHPDVEIEEDNPYAGKEFNCPSCDHTAKTKANIVVHFARTHCKEWIPAFTKECKCTGCQKDFKSSTAYLYHAVSCIKPIPQDCVTALAQLK